MDNTWVKLYRKIDNNKLIKDAHALQIFIFLLVNVNKETGEYTTGRKLLAAQLGMRDATAYSALMRLQRKYGLLNIKSNNRFSTITLLNWAKYQAKNEASTQGDNNTSSATHQRINTNQEIKNKEIQEIDTIGDSRPKIPIKGFSEGINEKVLQTNDLEMMDQVEDHHLSVVESKTGITKEWQDKAFRYADKLKIKLEGNLKPRWLKVFKQAYEGRNTANLEKAYSFLVDYNSKPLTSMQKALYFFSIYENGMKPMNFT